MNSLFIVGVPIGNLEDITLRAIKILQNVDFIACEDTRVTRKLLSLLNIKAPKLISYHNFNEKNSAKGIIKLINEKYKVALVSDAGMPFVADPGYVLINEAISNNIKLEIIPGPCAMTSALVLANFKQNFSFWGFLKPKTIQRQNQLKSLSKGVHIFYISPYKLLNSLKDIDLIFKNQVQIFLVKEMTKKFETHYRGYAFEIIEKLEQKIKGEYTLVLNIK